MAVTIIRALGELDLSDAIRLIVDSFTLYGQTPSRYNVQRVRERLVASFSSLDYAPRFLIAEQKGRIVGIAGYGKMEMASRTWGLFLSSVHRDFGSQGIGTELNRERLHRIEDNEESGRIIVSTIHRNRFERCGFTSVDYDREVGLYLMLKRFRAGTRPGPAMTDQPRRPFPD